MDLWGIIVAIILGIVEGLTEFAPVSSTGHMILVDDIWLNSKELYSEEVANTFKVVIQLGSILAVVIVLWRRFFELLPLKENLNRNQEGRLGLMKVIVGLIPAIILGFLFEDYIDEYLFSMNTVLIGLVAGAILMIIADRLSSKTPKVESVDQVTYKQAFLIGLFQCIALWPGFSRSGSTISGGVILGMSHRAAADFTFIMAVPIMLGASALSLLKNWEYFTPDAFPFLAAGFISAFIFAYVSVRFFLKLIHRIKLTPFAIYRIILAAVVYVVFF
ncbi:undecaprenyl-diphosphatase [Bacillus mesophilus]|uniref:Undecaprenyl-diphosphatase n=1 Tax=Bacillus mesophilus TaxID=1808955 RepID=A0A6M0QAP4_9BACI|nr:undecaprenyl-diphosphate phosphatase [Bacillus mesophilus]MBM7662569.1 undecaprenyl-diphosphatase [Bacillus mesophilus]NEY73363.1 undecaprenyl-diphosphate phosphatase [Bacillus mesophilus]